MRTSVIIALATQTSLIAAAASSCSKGLLGSLVKQYQTSSAIQDYCTSSYPVPPVTSTSTAPTYTKTVTVASTTITSVAATHTDTVTADPVTLTILAAPSTSTEYVHLTTGQPAKRANYDYSEYDVDMAKICTCIETTQTVSTTVTPTVTLSVTYTSAILSTTSTTATYVSTVFTTTTAIVTITKTDSASATGTSTTGSATATSIPLCNAPYGAGLDAGCSASCFCDLATNGQGFCNTFAMVPCGNVCSSDSDCPVGSACADPQSFPGTQCNNGGPGVCVSTAGCTSSLVASKRSLMGLDLTSVLSPGAKMEQMKAANEARRNAFNKARTG